MTKPAFSTLVELLRQRAQEQPDQLAYIFLNDGDAAEERVTYAQLDARARRIAAQLQQHHLKGERALLLYPPGLEYVVAYFGCLYAGVSAVPAYPPNLARLKKTVPRLMAISDDCGPKAALTTSEILRKLRPLLFLTGRLSTMRWIGTNGLPEGGEADWSDPNVVPTDVAFLQYTSGSTSAPKGVMVRHANLLDNLLRIEQSFGHHRHSQGVIWLPPYHDMGLIGGILSPLYTGFPCTLMSPLDFLRRPLRWLKAISHYGATTSGGPNFAYELCLRRVTPEQRDELDLSTWDVAFNGAEPIRPRTLRRFADYFEPSGFEARAFYPCYGLAESTLIVSGGHKLALPRELRVDAEALESNRVENPSPDAPTRALIGCGQAVPDHDIAIVCPETLHRLPADRVGEILVKGPSVAAGYWRNAEATEETFLVRLPETGEGPYLRTGDLGFIRDGELFVCGRRKEVIIIRGRNYYPQDIEQAAEGSHPALRTGCLAAFSVQSGDEERLALVAEIREPRGTNFEDVVAAIRRAVAEKVQLRLHTVALVPKDGVPKTSSGKIQRRLSRAQLSSRQLATVHHWTEKVEVGVN
ncbi:MAG: fatty acyl-AMP ligase [Vulcanimicrobiota bacterium]